MEELKKGFSVLNLDEIGPFAGMTYLGRQQVDEVIKETTTNTKSALTRLVERQSDVLRDDAIVFSGQAAFNGVWSGRHSVGIPAFVVGVGLFGLVCLAGIGHDVYIATSSGQLPLFGSRRMTLPEFFLIGGLTTVFASAIAAVSGWLLTHLLRRGYFTFLLLDEFRSVASKSWIIGETAIYVSTGGPRPEVKTVFYDAIGTVEVEETPSGLDRAIIRSRDGTAIAEILAPTTTSTDSAFAIADEINAHIAD